MNKFFVRPLLSGLVALSSVCLSGVSHAADYTESSDAGATLASVQYTAAQGAVSQSLGAVSGSLLSLTDADLFYIYISDPLTFSASTVNSGTDDYLDTQLFLFSADGKPVFANDDDATDPTYFRSTLSGGVFKPTTAGLYILGISLSGYDPINAVNQLLFDVNSDTTATRGPDSSLGTSFLAGFSGSNIFGPEGNYSIQLNGAMTAPVPEPATWLLSSIGLVAIALASRRRRSASHA